MRLATGRCDLCPPDQTTEGGIVTSCTPCPKGKTSSFSGTEQVRGRCYCPTNFKNKDGECVVCALGTHSDRERCINCPPGLFGKFKYGELLCEQCTENTVKTYRGATTCVPCPAGSVEGENILGKENNKCVPIDPYNKDPKFLTSLPGIARETNDEGDYAFYEL